MASAPANRPSNPTPEDLFAELVGTMNDLGEIDWAALLADDPSPDVGMIRAVTLQGLAMMLQQLAVMALEPVQVLLAALTAAMISQAGE